MAASECFNVMNHNFKGSNMAMKIDIRKAFDTVNEILLLR